MKAFLIMDMPNSCSECNFQQYAICHAVRKSIVGTPEELKSKPDWCPLKPMPEKKPSAENFLEVFINIGYNSLIDEMIPGKDNVCKEIST